MSRTTIFFLCFIILFPLVGRTQNSENSSNSSGEWISLFNGKNLEGWTSKITGSKAGENYKNTFRVEDGLLKVSYDRYERFDGEFGHLFYKDQFSNYILRLEYRFVGEQSEGGPDWAYRNSGVMVHSQSPETMRIDQEFPVSVEVQLLGGNGTDERTTANICTPGTHVVIDGKLVTQHCINSSSKTYHGDQWVTLEVEVRGNSVIRHRINGVLVFEYGRPRLDETDSDGKSLLKGGHDKLLESGYICVQAESHPVEFRKIELRKLN